MVKETLKNFFGPRKPTLHSSASYVAIPVTKFTMKGTEEVFRPKEGAPLDTIPYRDFLKEHYKPREIFKRLMVDGILPPKGVDFVALEPPSDLLPQEGGKELLIDCLAQSCFHTTPEHFRKELEPLKTGSDRLHYLLCLLEFQWRCRTEGDLNDFHLDLKKIFYECLRFDFFSGADLLQLRKS